ncbi:MFS transporter [Phenylobacterium sp.]|uniref:MFS transporter n=1 Tax=Phenylobacterium sp. TaxID=1871053 RepID=UPI00286B1F09|nr:MFS transporter [Phenylobacterium sp.]
MTSTSAVPSDLVPASAKLGVPTKLFYGFGSVAFGVAGLGLASSLLQPYLNRVIGLPALWVGTAIMLTLMLDAVIDPAIGRWSDNLRTRWGRRHPLMYASAPLIAMACIGFWNSPADWSLEATGAYLIGMLVVLRICISLYEIPSQALAPELTTDYHERTSLFSYRYLFAVIAGVTMNVVLYQVYLSPAAGGVLNRAAYAQYGVLAASLMAVSILVSALGTHRQIPRLSRPAVRDISFGKAVKEVIGTLSNRSLVVVMLSGLCSGVGTGMSYALSQYFYLELWGLSAAQISYLAIAGALASICAVALAGPASKVLGKKRAMLTLFSAYLVTSLLPLTLKLLGLMPPNSSPAVFWILIVDNFIYTTLVIAGLIIISSMIADVVEDAAVKTGVRSEGLLFAANGLLPKFTAGIGVFMAGLLLTLVAFPTNAAQGSVDPAIMMRLVSIYLPVIAVMNTLSVIVLAFYHIDQDTHEQNLATLREAAADLERASELAPDLIPPRP